MRTINCLSRLMHALMCLSLLAFIACSKSPNAADGNTAFQKRYKLNDFAIADFQKTDGQQSKAFGVEGYRMSFAATLECVGGDGCCLRWDYGPGGMYKPVCLQKINIGQRITTTGSITFQKSEKGWTDVGMEINR